NMSIKDLLNQRLKEAQPTRDTIRTTTDSVTQAAPDSVKRSDNMVNTDNYQFEEQVKREQVISTDNYNFEDEAEKQAQPTESFLTRYMKAREKSRITGPFPYEEKFSADNLVASLVIDPMRGLGVLLETQMNDMLENYRFYGGIMSTLDLRQGDVFAQFEYLPHFMDFSIRFDRRAVRWDPETPSPPPHIYKYTLHQIELGASIPFTDRVRVSLKPFGA